MRSDLVGQDWLTTVVEQEAAVASARVIGSMVDFIAPDDTRRIVAALANPAIRIVSLTITEGGYCIDPATQAFDAAHPDIVADAADLAHPRGVFGVLLAALAHRRAAKLPPFTLMSCDNLPGNGDVTRNAVAGLADQVDLELAAWVREAVAFPSSMVDRITPATGERERALVQNVYGIADARPVFCEAFRQWVVEDHFTAGRPALERVGVQFVADVQPFELMKIRILNGGHAAIAYPAALLDLHFVHDAMAEPLVADYLRKLLDHEVIPVVPPVPGTDLHAYRVRIESRFANPRIGDTIRRLCLDGSNRQPKFVLPTALAALERGSAIKGLALVSAFWCRYCYGTTESGKAIAPNDDAWPRLQAAARTARHDPAAWLALRDIFGDLAERPRYAHAFSDALQRVWRDGTRATLAHYRDG
jgi:mannitol 2-dehydrogenase